MASVKSLHSFALKGGEGSRIASTGMGPYMVVDRFGDRADHRFAVVDSTSGKIIDQKTYPRMSLICAEYSPVGAYLRLAFRGDSLSDLTIYSEAIGDPMDLNQFGEFIPALSVEHLEAQQRLNNYLETEGNLRLVKFDENRGHLRGTDPNFTTQIGQFGRSAFQGGSPFHIVSAQSAAEISVRAQNEGLREIDISRWRANIVVYANYPFAEDEWVGKRIKIGEVILRVTRRAPRCPIPGVNQFLGTRDVDTRDLYKAINRNLPAEHNGKLKPMVGVYAFHENEGRIDDGDKVEVLGDII